MDTLKAFHNDPAIKEKYLNQVIAHRKAGNISQDAYWENDQGGVLECALELDVKNANPAIYLEFEKQLGIPQILAMLKESIFEELLEEEEANKWPEKFLSAIPVGADLSHIWPQFALWLLTDPEQGVIHFAQTAQQRTLIQQIADLYCANTSNDAAFEAAIAHVEVVKVNTEATVQAAWTATDHSASQWHVWESAYSAQCALYSAISMAKAFADPLHAVQAAYAAAHAAACPTVHIKQADKLLTLLKAA